MHSQERLHHLLRFTPTPPAAIADQQQQSGEYADAIRAERFYYQSMASQYMKDYWIHFFTPTIWQKKKKCDFRNQHSKSKANFRFEYRVMMEDKVKKVTFLVEKTPRPSTSTFSR